jgi:hypothetical protein
VAGASEATQLCLTLLLNGWRLVRVCTTVCRCLLALPLFRLLCCVSNLVAVCPLLLRWLGVRLFLLPSRLLSCVSIFVAVCPLLLRRPVVRSRLLSCVSIVVAVCPMVLRWLAVRLFQFPVFLGARKFVVVLRP